MLLCLRRPLVNMGHHLQQVPYLLQVVKEYNVLVYVCAYLVTCRGSISEYVGSKFPWVSGGMTQQSCVAVTPKQVRPSICCTQMLRHDALPLHGHEH